MKIDLFKIKQKLNIQGDDLLTRPLGEQFYESLRSQFASSTPEPILELNFDNIKTIDFSFADECIARLIQEDILKNRCGDCVCLISNLKSITALENLHVALDYHRKVCCFAVSDLSTTPSASEGKLPERTGRTDDGRNYILLGSLEELLYETLGFLITKRQCTARTIADEFDLKINTASTRLQKLYKAHLIHRIEDVSSAGRQFIYRSPF